MSESVNKLCLMIDLGDLTCVSKCLKKYKNIEKCKDLYYFLSNDNSAINPIINISLLKDRKLATNILKIFGDYDINLSGIDIPICNFINGDVNVIIIMVEKGMNIPEYYHNGNTSPLITAVKHNHIDIVKYLVDKVDIHWANNFGFTAFIHANLEGNTEIISTLLLAGANSNINDREI